MVDSLINFKELYDVYLKLTYPVEIGGKYFEEGEIVAKFDKILVAGLNQVSNYTSANGGFDNRAHVYWETTKEVQFSFSQGVFSKTQFALLSNSRLLNIQQGEQIIITKSEMLETKEDGTVELSEEPIDKIFIYNASNGQKIDNFTLKNKTISLKESYLEIVVNYQYAYTNGAKVAQIGKLLIGGFLELEGKTRVKDDITGHEVTGLIKIPKLKLMSDLSMRLGTKANPMVGTFKAVGVPVGSRGDSYVCEFFFLNNDIDSDF